MAQVKLLYFAWVREKVGRAEETIDIPAGIDDVAGLVTWLRGRGEEFEIAFADPGAVRVAVNQQHVRPEATIADAREIAFFPPVTGG